MGITLTDENPNTQIQKHSENGLSLQQGRVRLVELGGVINKLRVLQGFNMLGPQETMPLALIWAEQLDRFKISPKLYDEILNRCIDFRRKALLDGKDFIPALSVELFLAMFESYRTETMRPIWILLTRIRDVEGNIKHATMPFSKPDGTILEREPHPDMPEWTARLSQCQDEVSELKRQSYLFEDE